MAKKVKLTGRGYYRVFLGRVEKSRHLLEREAAAAVTQLKQDHPDQEAYYDHDLKVDAEFEDA